MTEQSNSSCILLLSNSHDFATDYVVAELRDRGAAYMRLDLDLLHLDSIDFDPITPTLRITNPQGEAVLGHAQLASILFRAPTHQSESTGTRYSPEEQIARHQWAAFSRSLTIFENARWVNHPVATYAAESKPYQLYRAHTLGWPVLRTQITNSIHCDAPHSTHGSIIKSLDTFYTRDRDNDLFHYSRAISTSELASDSLAWMPVILQEAAEPKVDLRVTVVGHQCFAVAILRSSDTGAQGDWRLQKDDIYFQKHDLPEAVAQRCQQLVESLGLVFGAIDLVLYQDEYYFLEINPTGEWAWLVDQLGLEIPRAIANHLLGVTC